MQVFAPAGRITGAEPSAVGAQTISYICNFNFEIAFLAVAGITGAPWPDAFAALLDEQGG